MPNITNKQTIVIVVTGKTADGSPASLDGFTLDYSTTDAAVGVIVGAPEAPKLAGLAAGSVAVVVTATRGDLVITKTSEAVSVTDVSLVDIDVTFGDVADA